MHRLRTAAAALRQPRRTLRMRLTLLYGALFCACAVALALAAQIFKPNFLVSANHTGHTQPAHHQAAAGGMLAGGTSTHDVAGSVAMLAIMVVLAVGTGWLIAGRALRPLRTITATTRDISARNLHQRLAAELVGLLAAQADTALVTAGEGMAPSPSSLAAGEPGGKYQAGAHHRGASQRTGRQDPGP